MNITKNFSYEEFYQSATARKMGFYEQFTPPDDVVENIERLVINLLQPLRDLLPGVMIISSGYRCPRLNQAVGGVQKKDGTISQHVKGEAADIIYTENGLKKSQKLIETLRDSGLDFDQCIDEKKGTWVHLSYSSNNRKQFLKL